MPRPWPSPFPHGRAARSHRFPEAPKPARSLMPERLTGRCCSFGARTLSNPGLSRTALARSQFKPMTRQNAPPVPSRLCRPRHARCAGVSVSNIVRCPYLLNAMFSDVPSRPSRSSRGASLPAKNQVPHSTTPHYPVLCRGGGVLCLLATFSQSCGSSEPCAGRTARPPAARSPRTRAPRGNWRSRR